MKTLLPTLAVLALTACALPTIANGQSERFTINAGSIVQTIYLDDSNAIYHLDALEAAITQAGGDHLASFEIINNQSQDHPMTHVVMLQWADPSDRAELENSEAWSSVDAMITDVGFFGVQQDTPVELHEDRIYDGTHAWTIAESPEQMAVVMQIIGRYFEAIEPVLKEYQIGSKAFFGPVAIDGGDYQIYTPQIFGLFEWQRFEDIERFQKDERWLSSVDVRDATFTRKEDTWHGRAIF